MLGASLNPPTDSDKVKAHHRCNRCPGQHLETPWHKFYACADNDDIGNPIIASTKWLIPMAEKTWDSNRCLWARGLMPADWFDECKPTELPLHEAKVWATNGFAKMLEASGTAYPDGAGCGSKQPKATQVVAFGAGTFLSDPSDTRLEHVSTEGICGQVPGRQTVPRAELWGRSSHW